MVITSYDEEGEKYSFSSLVKFHSIPLTNNYVYHASKIHHTKQPNSQ